MSSSSTPTSENNLPQRSPLSNRRSPHSSVQSSPQHSSNDNENDNSIGIEQNSPIRSDSDSDHEAVRHKRVKRHIADSSQDGSRENRPIKESPWEITEADTLKNNSDNEDIDDLFGGAVSDDDEHNEYSRRDSIEAATPISDDEKYTRPRSFNTGHYELTYAKPPGSCDGKYYIAKLPNFFTYCNQAYAPESYTEEDDYKHETTIRLGAENTIRWRYKRNEMGGETEVKESNTKMIKWSDGSMTLLIGEEMFLINSHDISKQHTFLGVPNIHSNSIENHARLTNQITFRPDANSRTHKRLSAAIQARNVKQVKTKFVDINDPKLIELQLQGEREKKPRNERRTATTSKSRSRKRSFDDYSDPDEPTSYTSYRRNDSYEDDTGFVVADENDSDDDYGRPEKRHKGKERATERRRKRDLSSDDDLPRTRKRHHKMEKAKNFDEYEENDQEDQEDNDQEEHEEHEEEDGDISPATKQTNEDVEDVNADVDINENLLLDNDDEDEDMPVVNKKPRRNRNIFDDD
ncbi:RNA polymerase-associated protein LEO1 [Rhizophagus clarus]|uniref:RNA polymerase-associated protein LEO1 n=1 Tax=Rhizophagus clarus TaxID=94130 RepID=A0A8H3M5E0_9GLOM|nr:RNA polymerase-associated protein LEO1 [Rhizophagus clarus]